ncbi:T-complex 11 [Dichotomocladium elegans]|nr:T-complex 11 [Dichotomocladium elegans]
MNVVMIDSYIFARELKKIYFSAQRLLKMIPQGSVLYNQVNDSLDIELITQEAIQKTFDLDRTLRFVVHIMSQICAPVRDEAIRNIGEIESPIQRLQATLEMLDEMLLDLGNYRLRALRPHLIPIAVEYERSKFAESLANGAVGLARTRNWLRQAVRRLNDVATERNPDAIQTDQPKVRASAVFEEAFVSLLTSPEIADSATCPETLLLDVDRMRMYQNEAQSITIVAALVMLARNFGHAGDLGVLTKKLFVMLEDGQTTIDNLALEIERTVRVSPERKPMIRAMVDKTISHSDTVYSLLMRRVGSVIRSQLQSGNFASREVLVSYGLDHVRKPLEMLSNRLMMLGRHHRQVYAPWYDEIIKDEIDASA